VVVKAINSKGETPDNERTKSGGSKNKKRVKKTRLTLTARQTYAKRGNCRRKSGPPGKLKTQETQAMPSDVSATAEGAHARGTGKTRAAKTVEGLKRGVGPRQKNGDQKGKKKGSRRSSQSVEVCEQGGGGKSKRGSNGCQNWGWDRK